MYCYLDRASTKRLLTFICCRKCSYIPIYNGLIFFFFPSPACWLYCASDPQHFSGIGFIHLDLQQLTDKSQNQRLMKKTINDYKITFQCCRRRMNISNFIITFIIYLNLSLRHHLICHHLITIVISNLHEFCVNYAFKEKWERVRDPFFILLSSESTGLI